MWAVHAVVHQKHVVNWMGGWCAEMPKYASHIIFNLIILCILFILYQYTSTSLTTLQLVLFLTFYVIGSVILTPDLDSKSEAARRCGIACLPYRKIFKHRGASHHPFYGVASRILYVAALALIVLWLLWMFGWKFSIDGNTALNFMILHIKEIGVAGTGLFIANLLHIFLDKIT